MSPAGMPYHRPAQKLSEMKAFFVLFEFLKFFGLTIFLKFLSYYFKNPRFFH